MASQKIYDMVTERIIDKIQLAITAIGNGEKGIAPWNRPWYQSGIPMNLKSKKAYRGMNIFLLSALGYPQPFFVTANQATELHIDFVKWGKINGRKAGLDKDGNIVKAINKGEKSCPIVFWKWVELDKDKAGNPIPKGQKKNRFPYLKYYNVFNVSQCNGLDHRIPELPERTFNPIADGDRIIADMPNRPDMTHNEARAFYRPSTDMVNLPKHELFKTDAEYYSTAFHELVHATGHTSRLSRKEVMDGNMFGSHDYSTEELVAEMGAVYLCNEIGVDSTEDNSLAYLKSWLGKLKDDTKMLVMAAGRAQKAVDYILNPDKDEETGKDATTKS